MNTIKKTPQETALETALHYRSLGLLCRQQAALHPEARWSWLSEAERWEDLAARQQEPSRLEDIPPIAA
jgi:hypothetical protein